MADVEISKEEAALILHDFKTALEDLNDLLRNEAKQLADLSDVGTALGSGVDGEKSLAIAKENGQNIVKYVQDTIDKVTDLEKRTRARFNAIFGADFDSAIDISKLDPNLGNQGHLTGF
ncbi:hypothetical protein Srot_1418 [Segniliparus rotundus DSM 44985]|uniref:Uncharacterized protein n=1 Tax=Segniliparus rotundus (strain ATCC BAA-972 / CDC 1076 / CIP 108378 / DSM 44985 / JCM 13578) TaxID=640132 RepID=D6Z7F2_SEGRD|nr:hypothetical protein [Segniliparus rotundus]ADG97882.1 hypothetical protein Srot_1418 [Segniliparus rotundus DSM 44985]